MSLKVQLDKLLQHYTAVQAVMLDITTNEEFLYIDKELAGLEYQIDLLKLKIGELENDD